MRRRLCSGVVVANLFTRDEKMTPGSAVGVVVGFSGVAIMVGPEALAGIGTDVLAQLAVLGAGICYAWAPCMPGCG